MGQQSNPWMKYLATAQVDRIMDKIKQLGDNANEVLKRWGTRGRPGHPRPWNTHDVSQLVPARRLDLERELDAKIKELADDLQNTEVQPGTTDTPDRQADPQSGQAEAGAAGTGD